MHWERVGKFDRECASLADRHYSRRTKGSPQFMPPGQTVVLKAEQAVFGWWRQHPSSGIKQWNNLDGWTCTIFRNESAVRSSDLCVWIRSKECVFLCFELCGPPKPPERTPNPRELAEAIVRITSDEKLVQITDVSSDKYATVQDVQDYLSKFWANERDPLKFWASCKDKEEEYFDACARRGLFNIARLSFSMYFGTTNTQGTYGQWQTQSVSYGGDNQELLEVTINEYRSFVDQITNMACRNRPAFQAQVSNTDYGSLAQVNASDSLVQYFYEDAYGERKERESKRSALELRHGDQQQP